MTFKMKKIVLATSVVVSALMLQACNDATESTQVTADVPLVESPATEATEAEMKSLDVNVIYLDRSMLPPGAVLEVTLEDISKADAPSELIVSQSMEPASAPPFAMVLDYDVTKIVDKHRYSLRATIKVQDQLVMTSTTSIDPFAEGAAVPIEIKLDHVAQNKTTDVTQNTAFTDTYWKLVQLGGQDAKLGAAEKEVFIQFASEGNAAHGFSGCNSFKGGFEIDQGKLTMGPIASTRKMCAEGMDQEQAFLSAMGQFASYSTQGEALTVKNNQDEVVATFESRDMN
jgi:putative lipoprotein